jgi:hypothetical protein
MTGGDATIVVATTGVGLGLNQSLERSALVQVRMNDLDQTAATWGGRLDLDSWHR